ncbi:MAG: trypsin-like peptidase domain-containing protein [Gammaproteobacteria bacterium]|nr:trypsin-like peptidase domain-containing protein [Gammaproteobacteria bacterium]
MRKFLLYLAQGAFIGLIVAFIYLLLFQPHVFEHKAITLNQEAKPTIGQFEQRHGAIGGPVSYANAVDLAAPAVVNIHTTKIIRQRRNPMLDDPFFRRFFGDKFNSRPRQRAESSLGSGVIVSSEGYVLTNNHVIEGADEIVVALADGRSSKATVVGTDPDTDLAALKIHVDNLPVITVGQSDLLAVGDVVLAIGNPFGVGQTVTMGIVSATGRSGLNITTFENFIQTDAAINPGNSGGALINAFGQLVGVNTAIFSKSGGSQGIGFAIPTSVAIKVLEQLIATGHAIRGWLGIEVQDITPRLAQSFHLDSPNGILVAGVLENGPAHRAGFRSGDIIVDITGIDFSNGREMMNQIAQTAPGEKLIIELIRDRQSIQLETIIGQRPQRN